MKKIILLIAPIIIFILAFRPVNSFTVSGIVSDEAGVPIPGISVQVKGTRTGVATANDGTYKLSVPNSNDVLVFSDAGIETKEEKIAGRTTINITLKRLALNGTEVVVTAIGQSKAKKEVSSSVRIRGMSTIYGARSAPDATKNGFYRSYGKI